MNVYTPRQAVLTGRDIYYNYGYLKDLLTGINSYIPIFVNGSFENFSNLSFFRDTKGRTLNDCCHAKLTDAIGLVPNCTNTKVPATPISSDAEALQSGICHYHDDFNNPQIHEYVSWVCHANTTVIYTVTFVDKPPFKDCIYLDCEVRTLSDFQRVSYPIHIKWKATGQHCLYPVVTGTNLMYSITHTTDPTIGGLDTLLGASCKEYVDSVPKNLLLHRTVDECTQIVKDLVCLCEANFSLINFWNPTVKYNVRNNYESWTPVVGTTNMMPPEVNFNSFLFHEPESIFTNLPQWLTPNTFQSYWVAWGINHAFIDACEDVPILNNNSLQNIFEVVSFIKSLVIDHRIEIPKRLSDAWLAYRYQLGTSTMDAQDAIQFMNRHIPTGFSNSIKTYGQETYLVDDVLITIRCCIEVRPKALNTLDEIWTALYKYGLQPNFYVLWDSIPLSFVADWFIPIGDALEASDAEQYLEETYEILSQDYSLSYSHNINGYSKVHCYSRWRNDYVKLDPLYWFDKKPSSNKTHIFRFFDGVSLLIGHK